MTRNGTTQTNEYLGMLFQPRHEKKHLSMPAPAWSKAAGYGWLIIDTTVGAMALNGVPRERPSQWTALIDGN
jgi:hypothetical protein